MVPSPDRATAGAEPHSATHAAELASTGTESLLSLAAGTIEAKRIAVIRGKVLKKDNIPLSGVTITVLNHPELGQTLSRADGRSDTAVNGGGVLTVSCAKPDRAIETAHIKHGSSLSAIGRQPGLHYSTISKIIQRRQHQS